MARAPIFVGGMFKSGTSLLRAMLGQHSAIASGLETYWFDWNWSARDSEAMKVMYGRLAHFFDMTTAEVTTMAMASDSAEKFLSTLMADVARRQGKPRWAEKTPGNIAHADRIWKAWPDAQIVHIIRDPRDVFASLVEAKKWDSPDEFAERWISTIGRGLRLNAELNPSPKAYMAIRYEDLTAAPEKVMRGVIDFLGEPWEAAAGQFSGREEDFTKVLEATGKASTTLERLKAPISGERVGIWPQVLSEKQLADIKGAIGKRGYGDIYERVTAESPAA
jgi:hypothetical protein